MTDIVTLLVDNQPIEVSFYDDNTLEAQEKALQAEAARAAAVIARTATELARDQAADLVDPANIFVDVTLGTAEATVSTGTTFKLVTSSTGLAEVRKRTSGGSDLLYTEATISALQADDGAGVIKRKRSGTNFRKRGLDDIVDQQPFLEDWIGGYDEVRIQRAVNDIAASGGGTIYCRQDGGQEWEIGDLITVPTGVTLDWGPGPAGKADYPGDVRKINVTAGEGGDGSQNIITMERNSAWRGGAFKFGWQDLDNDTTLTPAHWLFGTNGESSGADFIEILNTNIGAAYRGINMDNGGGWVLDVRGQPMIGLRIDRVYGSSTIRHLEWWTFALTQAQNPILYDWMLANSIGLDLYRCDDVAADNIFAWNVGKVIRSQTSSAPGGGSSWMHISNLRGDFCDTLLDLADVNIMQIANAFITQRNASVSKTLGRFRSTATRGCVQIGNLQAYSTSQAFVIEDGCGVDLQVSNPHPRRTADDVNGNAQHALFVNEGQTAKVKLGHADYHDVAGPVQIGDANPFVIGTDITPTNFGNATGWAGAGVSQDGDDIVFNLNQSVDAVQNLLSDRMRQEKLCIIACKLRTTGIANLGAAQHYLRLSDGGSLDDMLIPGFRIFNPVHGDADDPDDYRTFIKLIEIRDAAQRLQWVFGGASGASTVRVRDLAAFAVDPRTLDQRMLAWLQAKQPNGNSYLPSIGVSRGRRTLSLTAAPTAGSYLEGEEWRRTPQVAGQPLGGRCTVGGSPGTWVNLPNL